MTQAVETLFEKLGGKPAIETVVGDFYDRVLGDLELKPYFANTDMEKQKNHQVNFISMVLGGPNQYSGRSMKKAHEELNITADHFFKVAGHLDAALTGVGVTRSDVEQIIQTVAGLKNEVVST